MRIHANDLNETLADYRQRAHLVSSAPMYGGCLNMLIFTLGGMLPAAALVLIQLLLSFVRPVGAELAAICMGVGIIWLTRTRFARAEANPFGSFASGAYIPPRPLGRDFLIANLFVFSGLWYFVFTNQLFDIVFALIRLFF